MTREPRGRDHVVAWKDDACVVPERPERDGKRADDVAQSAGLDEVRAFGRDEQHGDGRGHRRRNCQFRTKLSSAATTTPTMLSPAMRPEEIGTTNRPACRASMRWKIAAATAPATNESEV